MLPSLCICKMLKDPVMVQEGKIVVKTENSYLIRTGEIPADTFPTFQAVIVSNPATCFLL